MQKSIFPNGHSYKRKNPSDHLIGNAITHIWRKTSANDLVINIYIYHGKQLWFCLSEIMKAARNVINKSKLQNSCLTE